MSDLRKAAEQALEALEWNYGTDLCDIENCTAWLDKMNATISALRQALAHPEQEPWVHDLKDSIEKGTKAWADVPDASEWVDELRGNTPDCKTHPDAPHGFDRNASHSADRYVCECEGWEPVDNAYTKLDTTAGVLHKEWVGLSEDEFEKILETHNEAFSFAIYLSIEAKLKEKNG